MAASLQYSCLENPMDGGAWWAVVQGVARSRTRLSDFTFHFHALEKEMATHSSVLAWRIPGTGEPDGLSSMGLHRVGHDWSDLAAAAAAGAIFLNHFLASVRILCLSSVLKRETSSWIMSSYVGRWVRKIVSNSLIMACAPLSTVERVSASLIYS